MYAQGLKGQEGELGQGLGQDLGSLPCFAVGLLCDIGSVPAPAWASRIHWRQFLPLLSRVVGRRK